MPVPNPHRLGCEETILTPEREETMEFLLFLGILALWIILQIWVLPRLGFNT